MATAFHRELTALRMELKAAHDRLSSYEITLEQPHVLEERINRITVRIFYLYSCTVNCTLCKIFLFPLLMNSVYLKKYYLIEVVLGPGVMHSFRSSLTYYDYEKLLFRQALKIRLFAFYLSLQLENHIATFLLSFLV